MSEKVLVFPGAIAPRHNGYSAFSQDLFDKLLSSSTFLERKEAENSTEYKQLIPYIGVFDRQGNVFSYQRSSKQKESRLRSLYSIGIGGHINPIDGLSLNKDIFFKAAIREIEEEIGISASENGLSVLCFVNDDSNSVGRVHFGVCLGIRISEGIGRLEDTILQGDFKSVSDCIKDIENYETWSRFFLEFLSERKIDV